MSKITLTDFVDLLGFELADWQRDIIEKIENNPNIVIEMPSRKVRFSEITSMSGITSMAFKSKSTPTFMVIDELEAYDFPEAMALYDKEIAKARSRRDGTVTAAVKAKQDFVHKNLRG